MVRKRQPSPGKQLRRIRQQLGLTFRDVNQASLRIARELRLRKFAIPPSRLHDYETKDNIPSIFRVYTLARVYRRTVAEVLSWYRIPSL